jgi:hypothetical protein
MGLICARGSFPARMLKRRKTADLSGSCFPTLHFVKDGAPLFVQMDANCRSFDSRTLRSAQDDNFMSVFAICWL